MNRAAISVLVGFSFAIVGVSGILMKFASKSHALNEVHTWVGFFLVAVAIVHLVLNWKPFAGYLRRRGLSWLAVPFVVLAVVMLWGSGGGEDGRHGGGEAGRHGSGGAWVGKLTQAPVRDLATVFGKSSDEALKALSSAGLQVSGAEQTVAEIGQRNHRSPEAVLGVLAR